MPYDKDTPLNINESFSVSQPKITANFQEIDTYVSQDHVSFGSGLGQGKHKQVLFTEQGADVSTAADEMALYIKDNGGTPNTYLREESDGTIFNMTPCTAGHASSGSEIFPSGLKFIWGEEIVAGAGTVVTLSDGGFSTATYQVVITKEGLVAGTDFVHIVTGSITTTQFTATSHDKDGNNTNSKIRYIAIGK